MELGYLSHSSCSHLHEFKTFLDVAPQVRVIIEKVDAWLASLDSSVPPEVLQWGIHVEAGRTSQRVQDALILIDSFERLFERYRPSEVVVISDGAAWFEDKVLSEFLRARKISFLRYTTSLISDMRAVAIETAGALLSLLRQFSRLVAAKATAHAVSSNYSQGKHDLRRNLAVFHLCGLHGEHVTNVSAPMASLGSNSTLMPVALSWTIPDCGWDPSRVRQLKDRDLALVRQEWFVTLVDLMVCLQLMFRLLWRATRHHEVPAELSYQGTPLFRILKASFTYSLIAQAPIRFLFYRSMSRFLASHKLSAFKPWGGSGLFEGRLACRLVRENSQNVVIFNYWMGAVMKCWPYSDLNPIYMPDVFFAKGQYEKDTCISERGLAPDQVVIVGSPRFDRYKGIKLDQHTVNLARETIGLPPGYTIYVAVDPGCYLLGYLTVSEQIELISSICELAGRFASVCFVIKPHPSYPITHLLPFIEEKVHDNLIVLDGSSVRANTLLVAADVVISKYSTLLLEAALIGRPAVSVLFNRDVRFMVFGDMPETILSGKEMVEFLGELFSNPVEFENWRTARLQCQSEFLRKQYNVGGAQTSSDQIGNELQRRTGREVVA